MVGTWNKRMELLCRSQVKLSSAAKLKTNSLRRAITFVTALLLICLLPFPNKFSDWQNIHFFALHLEQLLESLHWTDY